MTPPTRSYGKSDTCPLSAAHQEHSALRDSQTAIPTMRPLGGSVGIRILSVTFCDGSHPQGWGVVSDTGGEAEVKLTCSQLRRRFLHLRVVHAELGKWLPL